MSASTIKNSSHPFIIATLATIALGILVAMPKFIRLRSVYAKCSCSTATRIIEGAKATWALEKRKMNTDAPTMSDLFGPNAYIQRWPECPDGGQYIIGRIDQKPRCTLPEHFLYDSEIEVASESGLGLGDVQIELQRANATICVLETSDSGHAWFFTNAYTIAPGWSNGTTYLRISMVGYRTEMVPIPDMWPLHVVLKKESDK